MSVRTARFLIAAFVALLAPALAQAQWITFTDMTSTRMSGVLTSTSTGDPNEKDFALGDLDKDGDLDLVNVRKEPFYGGGSRTHLLLMNVSGVLTDQTATYANDFNINPSLARVVIVADFDGDTWLDVVVVNTDAQPTQYYKNLGGAPGAWLGLQLSAGRIPTFTPGPRFCSAAAGDADNDGDLDLFLGDYNNSLENRLLINNGLGFFTDDTVARLVGGARTSTFSVEASFADMDLDGDMDIVESDGTVGTMEISINNGSGVYSSQFNVTAAATYTSAIGDLNNDGKIDIYQGRDGQDAYSINTSPVGGPLSFTTTVLNSTLNPKTAGFAGNAYIVDIDSDGDNDIVMADTDVDVPGCNRLAVLYRNKTIGNPTQTQLLVDPWGSGVQNVHTMGTHDIAVLDLNSDGLMDMVYGRCTGYHVFIQDGQPFSLQVTEPFPTALSLTVQNGAPNFTTYTLISTIQLVPEGSGPFFGLHESALTNFVGLQALGDPFVFQTDASGDHAFSVPGGLPTPFPTQWRAVQLTGPTGYSLTNVVTITF